MKRSFLFIGGKLDGYWLGVTLDLFGNPRPYHTSDIPPKPLAAALMNEIIPESIRAVQQVYYKREELKCESQTWYFYTPVDMTIAEGIDKLINGYKKRGEEGK